MSRRFKIVCRRINKPGVQLAGRFCRPAGIECHGFDRAQIRAARYEATNEVEREARERLEALTAKE